jgi:formylglycine-generating enzyme required for sulfatase activity
MRRLVILGMLTVAMATGCGKDDKPTASHPPQPKYHIIFGINLTDPGWSAYYAYVDRLDPSASPADSCVIRVNGHELPKEPGPGADHAGYQRRESHSHGSYSFVATLGQRSATSVLLVSPLGDPSLHIVEPPDSSQFSPGDSIPVVWDYVGPSYGETTVSVWGSDCQLSSDSTHVVVLNGHARSYTIPSAITRELQACNGPTDVAVTAFDSGAVEGELASPDSKSYVVLGYETVRLVVRPPMGACCGTGGSCTVAAQAACASPSTWQGASTSCTPNPCTQLTGACCTADNTCTVTTQVNCAATWTVGGVCTPNPCTQPPPTGSCCAVSGTCSVTTHAACTGTWTQGGVCTPNPCRTLTGMIWIPAGNVRLGQVGIAEPVNDFYVAGFYIDKCEVSNARYKAFIDAGGYTTQAYWNPCGWAWRVWHGITLPDYWDTNDSHGGGFVGNEQFPVNGVSWWEADAYCRWAGGRLPTEAEWEKAAKGGCETHGDPGQCDASDTPTYPWGEGITGPQANYWGSGDPYDGYDNGSTTPVGYYDGSNHGGYQTMNSPSPYGLYDMAGNVWEWCSTKYAAYPYNPNDGRENPPVSYEKCCRVLRGGGFGNDYFLRCAFRDGGTPLDCRNAGIGFRCVRTGS